MHSKEIFLAIETIAATSSKNEKTALVGQLVKDEAALRVLVAALDPITSYGISKRPVVGALEGDGLFDVGTWGIIDDLAARRLTGNNAIQAVAGEMIRLEPASSELFWRIIKKDLRAGFSAETVNKAMKGAIKTYPYMRCVLPAKAKFDEWDWAAGAFSQQKADGMFTNVDHDTAGVVRLTTRQGNELPIEQFSKMVEDIRATLARGTQTHGEIVVMVDGVIADRATSNGIMNSILAGGNFAENEVPVFFAWDQIPLTAVQPKGKHEVPYRERFKSLLGQLVKHPATSVRLIPTKIVYSLKEAYAHCMSLQGEGKEGTVLKNGTGFWKDTSGGNPDVVKLKLEVDIDLVTKAILPGEDGTKNEGRPGRITMETRDGLLSVNVAVKNEKLRDAIEADPSVFLERIWTVRFNEIMEPSDSNPLHSLFLPRMAEDWYRIDKEQADTLEEVYAQRDAAVRGEKMPELAEAA
ncbi:DNA ligase [Paraburkholderia sp.]|uniref:ATP-dependent DNA ligase n=1 Tax=Paraburkholderia sp. TaxID=1926495 RepID=UPI0039E4BFF2